MKASIVYLVEIQTFALQMRSVGREKQLEASGADVRWRCKELHPVLQLYLLVVADQDVVPARDIFPEIELGADRRRWQLPQLAAGHRWLLHVERLMVDMDAKFRRTMTLFAARLFRHMLLPFGILPLRLPDRDSLTPETLVKIGWIGRPQKPEEPRRE